MSLLVRPSSSAVFGPCPCAAQPTFYGLLLGHSSRSVSRPRRRPSLGLLCMGRRGSAASLRLAGQDRAFLRGVCLLTFAFCQLRVSTRRVVGGRPLGGRLVDSRLAGSVVAAGTAGTVSTDPPYSFSSAKFFFCPAGGQPPLRGGAHLSVFLLGWLCVQKPMAKRAGRAYQMRCLRRLPSSTLQCQTPL